ncbi:MAG: hypothetical protein K0Q59_5858 [Paenibacillus sp.]|nr:hypothetical protein [Paenibacillus sp.]
MRRSKKETIMLDPNNRLMNNDMTESAGMQSGSFVTEAAQEWAAGTASVKQTTRKPFR